MDIKATALLKLVYLEMFGHDMSWASFHVLEVMSSTKYLQKRVGYLGAVQSFRPDTEVLMLATNLLKKDISSSLPPNISLPVVTIPHLITPSLALSLVSDLMPRLSHSNPSIRKKTIAALYRLALVYPETLRTVWPKIKDLLMDENEDSSVTAAIINVVCELGWRRPRDFLPLAPRLFDLLVDGGNNWMAIKIIKLFATLTPLEPRLIKKLLPPLSTLIRTTPAMSLLYECIDGIIQGGIFEGTDGVQEGEEVASLCVEKLRGMIILEGDPNLKYVALLAFNKIVISYPNLVSMHQDIILSCIEDPDISIRLQALELGMNMVNHENLVPIVERLLHQLNEAQVFDYAEEPESDRRLALDRVETSTDSDDENREDSLRSSRKKACSSPALPDDYKNTVLHRIIDMCSQQTYANVSHFEWYIEVLIRLVRLVPPLAVSEGLVFDHAITTQDCDPAKARISLIIGSELRNVAVRIGAVRADAVNAADLLVSIDQRAKLFPLSSQSSQGVLCAAAWIVGEYADHLTDCQRTLTSLLHPVTLNLQPDVICAYLQAIPKVFASILSSEKGHWNLELKSQVSLLLARVVKFLECLTSHPSLEVQERSVEYLELMRVAAEAVVSHDAESETAPLLLKTAIPSLFAGFELKPVAPNAQRRVPEPENFNLDSALNYSLPKLLHQSSLSSVIDLELARFEEFYRQRPYQRQQTIPAISTIEPADENKQSYQKEDEFSATDIDTAARKRAERRERNRDDPYYIGNDEISSGTSTPFHEILRTANGELVDLDSIPIMELNLGDKQVKPDEEDRYTQHKRKPRQKVHIITDETLEVDDLVRNHDLSVGSGPKTDVRTAGHGRGKKSLLEVDSSGLGNYSLESGNGLLADDQPKNQLLQTEDIEMEKALQEVERLRLEMQRASERVKIADGNSPDGILVKKRRRKKSSKHSSSLGNAISSGTPDVAKTPKDQTIAGTATKEFDLLAKATVKKKKKKNQSPARQEQAMTRQ